MGLLDAGLGKLGGLWGRVPAGARNYLAGAGRGALTGWGYSMLGGAFMGGDQSQLGGMGVGAALGALGRHPRVGAFWNKRFAGKLGAPGRWLENRYPGGTFRGSPMSWETTWNKGITGSALGAAAMIGSTVLESNQPVNRF